MSPSECHTRFNSNRRMRKFSIQNSIFTPESTVNNSKLDLKNQATTTKSSLTRIENNDNEISRPNALRQALISTRPRVLKNIRHSSKEDHEELKKVMRSYLQSIVPKNH